MVKGAWIINLHTMRCKNWVNGIEVVFHFDEIGRPMGELMLLPAALSRELSEKMPGIRERMGYIYRIWRRAIVVFFRAYYRHLSRDYRGRAKPKSFSTVSAGRS